MGCCNGDNVISVKVEQEIQLQSIGPRLRSAQLRAKAKGLPLERILPLYGLLDSGISIEKFNGGAPSSPVVSVRKSSLNSTPSVIKSQTTMIWNYGVTTVPARRDSLLPRTLASLAAAGFDKPRLFVDGDDNIQSWKQQFGLEVTCRSPTIRTAGNWILALHELTLREPNADRFAVFQDDMIACHNLKLYLEKSRYPDKSYLNLLTELENELMARNNKGWFESNQLGRGAVALVFSREAAAVLLSNQSFIERAQDKKRGHKAIDGGILYAMQQKGWKEYCHSPSLVQHTGVQSTMNNRPFPPSKIFPGEEFDAMSLLT